MPPARTPIWDNFLTIPNDIDLDHIGIHFKARKNASYNNAWCIGCVDNYLNRAEYSQWQPLVWCDERTLALWRKYRAMNMVTPIRGQPKNLERHIRTCPNSKTAASQLGEPITSLSQLSNDNDPPPPLPHTPTPSSLPHPNNVESPPAQLISLSNVAQSSMIPLAATPIMDTPAREGRLSRQKQAELDADIYNLFTQLGIPFDDVNCSNFGAFVAKWIPGARWGTEDR